MKLSDVWTLAKETWQGFSDADAMSQAGAIAFYTALGLAPTILLFLTIAAYLPAGTSDAMIQQIEGMVGGKAAEGVHMVVESARERPQARGLAAVVGIVTVLISASGIFGQLQSALNRIWDVQPKAHGGYWSWIRKRLLSLGMVFSVVFLLLTSLVISAAINLVLGKEGPVWNLLNLAVSILLFTILFALVFKYLPDVHMRWRDVWVGAAITAILFATGKYLIGLYLGHSSLASGYGAAGSFIVLLAWVYYSAIILLFGAEVTQVYAKHFGHGIKPEAHAEAGNDLRRHGEQETAIAAEERRGEKELATSARQHNGHHGGPRHPWWGVVTALAVNYLVPSKLKR